MTHTPLSLSLTFINLLTSRFWAHLRSEGLAEQFVWTDDRARPTLRGVVDSAAGVDYTPLTTLHGVAERMGLDPDNVLDGIDAAGWVERCASIPKIGESGIVVGRGLVTLIDDGVSAEFVSACVHGGLRDAGLVRAAWKGGVPVEYAVH